MAGKERRSTASSTEERAAADGVRIVLVRARAFVVPSNSRSELTVLPSDGSVGRRRG